MLSRNMSENLMSNFNMSNFFNTNSNFQFSIFSENKNNVHLVKNKIR